MQEFVNVTLTVLAAEWASETGIIALLATTVAILIPVAILLIDPKQDKFPLDRSIVFRKIFLYKNFTALIIPVAISYIFPQMRLMSLGATIYLAILGIVVLSKIFKWLSSKDDEFGGETFRQRERIEYLKELEGEPEIIDAWSVILNSNYASFNQHGLLNVFVDASKRIKNNQSGWCKEQFWGLLRNNFDKIRDEDIDTYRKLVRTTLSYYLDRDEWLKADKEKRELNKRPPEALRQISRKLMIRAITGSTNSIEAYVYFDEVEKYLKSKNTESIDTFLSAYVDDVIDCFIKNDTDIQEKWSGDFFERIKITNANITEHGAILKAYYRSILLRYVGGRADNPANEVGARISNITERMFPEIDPIIWFRVITFIMWSHEYDEDKNKDAENKVKGWCERHRNYGVFGRLDCAIFSINEEKEELREIQIRKHIETEARNQANATYELLAKIFNLKDLDFSLYQKAIRRLEKDKNNNIDYLKKLNTLKTTLKQLSEHIK